MSEQSQENSITPKLNSDNKTEQQTDSSIPLVKNKRKKSSAVNKKKVKSSIGSQIETVKNVPENIIADETDFSKTIQTEKAPNQLILKKNKPASEGSGSPQETNIEKTHEPEKAAITQEPLQKSEISVQISLAHESQTRINQYKKNKYKNKQKKDKKEITSDSIPPLHEHKIPVKPIPKPLPKQEEKPKSKKPAVKPRPEILHTIIPVGKQLTKNQVNNEFLNNFYDKIEDYLKKQAYIEPGNKILLAVSGGVDSVVMMDAFAQLALKMRFNLYIGHFNHKLRGLSSDIDEQLVRNMSKEYNLQFYSSMGNVKQYSSKNSLSIEHAARILRYNFFERTARTLNVDIVATAHTEDDLVETFFINLLRGSGLTGLSSMPSKRKLVKNISLVRPFLMFNKKQLYEYAKIRKLVWNEDETNSLLNYTRNKIRHDLIPKLVLDYNPALIDVVNRTAELIQGADEVIKELVSKNINSVMDESNNERFQFKINMLQTFNKFMQGELIQYAWNKYFRMQPLPLATIDRILELNTNQTGKSCDISSGYYALRDRNLLIFGKKNKEAQVSVIIDKPGTYKFGKYKLEVSKCKQKDIKFTSDKNIEYVSASLIEPYVEIRNRREGDIFFPLGSPGSMKLSDFLINEKISLVDKQNILVLSNMKDILWVVGQRISEKCRISKNEENVYKLKLTSTDKKL